MEIWETVCGKLVDYKIMYINTSCAYLEARTLERQRGEVERPNGCNRVMTFALHICTATLLNTTK